MIELIDTFLDATGDLLIDLWLYMALGFLVTGIVEEFVSENTLLNYFGKNGPLAKCLFGSMLWGPLHTRCLLCR